MSASSSPFLSARLISRLSPLRRANLERRITQHVERLEDEHCDGTCYDKGEPCGNRLIRATRVLGRLSSITATMVR